MIIQALVIALIGYAMCFIVLGIIWAVLACMKFFMVPSEKKAKKQAEAVPAAPVAVAPAAEDDEELIAVMTAAIAASLNTSSYNLKIKSFRRLSNGASHWSTAGVNENLSNKLN